MFVSLSAQASEERDYDKTPFWRTLKSNGELNEKYPGGIELQKKLLEEEGHNIITKGKKNNKYYVKDFETKLYDL
ncbi:MAG: MGMT family protein [Mollicutes bacterium]|nr:MGMT family protein [Mollicutes bacterium]